MNIRTGGGKLKRHTYVITILLAGAVFILLGAYSAHSIGEPSSQIQQYPGESGRLISLPQLNDSGEKMVLESLILKFEGGQGYALATAEIEAKLPPAP